MYALTPTIHVYERHDWSARPWTEFELQNLPVEAFLHHGAELNATAVDTLAKQYAAMRDTQNFHMNVNGWDDIAYHYVVFQAEHEGVHARIFEGRPVHHIPAAQLGHNTGTLAICVYGDFQNHDIVKRNTRYAIETLLTHKPNLTGAGAIKTLGGHRDVVQTDCPGDALYAQLDIICSGAHLQRYRH